MDSVSRSHHATKNPKTFGKALLILSLFILTATVGMRGTSLPGVAAPVHALSTTYTLTEWAIPTASSLPVGMALDPSGNCCWFSEFGANKIAHFDPSTGIFQEWAIPTANSQTTGLATTTISGQTAVWGAEFNQAKIFVFFPSNSTFKEYALAPGTKPEYISVEPPGANTRVWFNEFPNKNGEFIYYGPSVTYFEDTFPGAVVGTNGVYAGAGQIYYAGATNIVKWDRVSNQYTIWTLPVHGSASGAFLAVDPLGQVWYTQSVNSASSTDNWVGVLRGDNTFKDWQVPTVGADLRVISFNPLTQHPWVAEYAAAANDGKIAELDPTVGGTNEGGGGPSVVAAGVGSSSIAEAVSGPFPVSTSNPPGTDSTAVGTMTGGFTEWALAANSEPHDVIIDSSGTTWLVESTANKLARLRPTAPDFTLSPSPASVTIAQGSSGTVQITGSSILSFSGPVTLSLTGAVPAGVTASFNPNPITIPSGGTASSTATIGVGSSVPAGSYTITVSGTGGPTRTTTFGLIVTSGNDFSLSLSSASLSVGAGSSGNVNVNINSLGSFSSSVSFSTSPLPAGVSIGFSPNTVTPPSGGSASTVATLSVASGTPASTQSITITGTSASLTHSQSFTLTITPPVVTPDFTVSANPISISINQGLSGTSAVDVVSANGFSSAVTLAYSWVGAAPSGVSVNLPSPVTPPSGSSATSTLTVTTTSSSSTGTFTLQVTGSSGSLSHNVNVGLTIAAAAAPKCLIATATYGSEVAPEVQLLRNFRDNSIMSTKSGSSFMLVFNAWYYSFSPNVAAYLNTHWVEQTVMKGVLFPLVGILYLASSLFSATSAYPELAVLVSGLLASSLIGAFYLGVPLGVLRARFRRLRNWKGQGMLERALAAMLFGGLGVLMFGELFSSQPALIISTATVVLSTLFISSAIVSKKICSRL